MESLHPEGLRGKKLPMEKCAVPDQTSLKSRSFLWSLGIIGARASAGSDWCVKCWHQAEVKLASVLAQSVSRWGPVLAGACLMEVHPVPGPWCCPALHRPKRSKMTDVVIFLGTGPLGCWPVRGDVLGWRGQALTWRFAWIPRFAMDTQQRLGHFFPSGKCSPYHSGWICWT